MSRPEDDLAAWRTAQKLSQTEAGALLRPPVSQSAWGAWESGAKPPSLHNAFEIERVTDGVVTAASWAKPHERTRRKARHRRPSLPPTGTG